MLNLDQALGELWLGEYNWSMNTSTSNFYSQFADQVATDNPERALDELAQRLIEHKRFRDLFEVRKIQLRRSMQLPILASDSIDTLSPAQRADYDQGLIAACREVGELLVADNRLREAWTFLQAVDDQAAVAELITSQTLTVSTTR